MSITEDMLEDWRRQATKLGGEVSQLRARVTELEQKLEAAENDKLLKLADMGRNVVLASYKCDDTARRVRRETCEALAVEVCPLCAGLAWDWLDAVEGEEGKG